ncbi:MAG: hypothetical protein GY940_27175, partial [bacterium]|nr:hypothetical protein [bacterium]
MVKGSRRKTIHPQRRPMFRMLPGLSIFFCLLFSLSVLLAGQSSGSGSPGLAREFSRYIISSWTIEDGLPQNSVLNLVQTRDGYIWFGTQSGLIRFDGVTFHVYNRWNSPQLKNDRILALYEDRNGTLWAGTDGGGLIGINRGQWNSYTVDTGLSGNRVRTITEDNRQQLWVGTDNGLNRITGDKITHFNMDNGLSGLPITALAAGSNGVLWIGTGSGDLNRMENSTFRPVRFKQEAALNTGGIAAL